MARRRRAPRQSSQSPSLPILKLTNPYLILSSLEEEAPHIGPGERDSKTDLMRRVPQDQMMLPFLDSIRGARFTARIPVGNRSQNKANVLSIRSGSDGKAGFRTVTGRLDHSYNVDMKCLKASL